jgi:acyl dehydratase
MAIDRKFIGHMSQPREADVEKGQLRFFAKAIGETDPIYFDEEAARAAGHPALPAPPTFLFSLHLGAPASTGDLFDAENGLGIDMRRVLHGEQRFTYHRPIYAGDRITLTTATTDVYDKKGGALEFVIQKTEGTNAAGELCAEMQVVTVVRNG